MIVCVGQSVIDMVHNWLADCNKKSGTKGLTNASAPNSITRKTISSSCFLTFRQPLLQRMQARVCGALPRSILAF